MADFSSQILPRLHGAKLQKNGEYLIRCPEISHEHDDTSPACHYKPCTGYHCKKCGANGGEKKLMEILGINPEQESEEKTTTYTYYHPDGALCGHVVRKDFVSEGNKCKVIRPYFNSSGKKSGIPKGLKGMMPLYGIHEVMVRPEQPVWVVEGEKCADALWRAGKCAVTSQGGSSNAKYSDWSPLSGRKVILWPDADDAGKHYADDVAALLRDLPRRPRIVRLDPTDLGLGGKEDAYDYIVSGRNLDDIDVDFSNTSKLKYLNLNKLEKMNFPPVQWAIPGLLPEGLSLLIGAPKLGKSWITLDFAWSVATGTEIWGAGVDPGGVLLCALEDPLRRIKSRLQKMDMPSPWPTNLDVVEMGGIDRLGDGGLDSLQEYVDDHPTTKLVIIDTLECVRSSSKNRKNNDAYQESTQSLLPVREFAAKNHVSVLVVTHTKKGDEKDVFSSITGSLGQTGVADGMMVIQRQRDSDIGSLHITGREIESKELQLRFSKLNCRWSLDTVTPRGACQEAILEHMREKGIPMSLSMIQDGLAAKGYACKTIEHNFYKAKKVGLIRELQYNSGKYVLTNDMPPKGKTPDNDVSVNILPHHDKNVVGEASQTQCEYFATHRSVADGVDGRREKKERNNNINNIYNPLGGGEQKGDRLGGEYSVGGMEQSPHRGPLPIGDRLSGGDYYDNGDLSPLPATPTPEGITIGDSMIDYINDVNLPQLALDAIRASHWGSEKKESEAKRLRRAIKREDPVHLKTVAENIISIMQRK
jgi:hypothetical protein